MLKDRNKTWRNKLHGGVADDLTPDDFDQEQLMIGKKVESEHTDDEDIQIKIAMDHMKETGRIGKDGKIHSDYYKKLSEMEKELKDELGINDEDNDEDEDKNIERIAELIDSE